MTTIQYTVTATSTSADVRAAAEAINKRLADAGDAGDRREVEREIAECVESLRDGLQIEVDDRATALAYVAQRDGVDEAWIDGDDIIASGRMPGSDQTGEYLAGYISDLARQARIEAGE
jgi:hypothetical protein